MEALGFPARWVDNHAGHVWVEARVHGRWVHVDPCEAAVDEPFLYAEQWGRCPEHVLAYQACSGVGGKLMPAAVHDVTACYRPPGAGPVSEETQQAIREALAKARAREEERVAAAEAVAVAGAEAAAGKVLGLAQSTGLWGGAA